MVLKRNRRCLKDCQELLAKNSFRHSASDHKANTALRNAKKRKGAFFWSSQLEANCDLKKNAQNLQTMKQIKSAFGEEDSTRFPLGTT
jgi:hypothetical protein